MLFIALWAYQTIYKVTIQVTPFKLVYGTQPIMPIKFMVPCEVAFRPFTIGSMR
jgi:hypothetical protein